MQTLSEKSQVILELGWKCINNDPYFAFKCAQDVMFYYFDASKKKDYLLMEELKNHYEEAVNLRNQIILPKTSLKLSVD